MEALFNTEKRRTAKMHGEKKKGLHDCFIKIAFLRVTPCKGDYPFNLLDPLTDKWKI
jgi:hypothetical protein